MRSAQVVSTTMFTILDFLARSAPQRSIGVAEISREVHLSPSVVSSNLKKLKELGLVDGERWGKYQITVRGKMMHDILSRRDWSDEELLQYWVKTVIRPRLLDMQNAANALNKRA